MPEYAMLNTDGSIRRFKDSPTQPPDIAKGQLVMRWLPVARETAQWYQRIEPPAQPVPANAAEVRFHAMRRPDPELWAEIRAKRNNLLRASDWTQVLDAPTKPDKATWAVYRQKLRDIPQTFAADPVTAVWPPAPGA